MLSAINVSNIHKVIYKNCLLNIKKVKTNDILKNIFDCLYKCLNYDKNHLGNMLSKVNDFLNYFFNKHLIKQLLGVSVYFFFFLIGTCKAL